MTDEIGSREEKDLMESRSPEGRLAPAKTECHSISEGKPPFRTERHGAEAQTAQPVTASRILLWDIDGTLMRSARTGAFKDYTIPMLEQVFGTSGRLGSGSMTLKVVPAFSPELSTVTIPR